MSAPYCRELVAKKFLDQRGVECFVPMQWRVTTDKNGRKSKELKPVVHNLIFARTTRSAIQELKTGVDFLQYRTIPENGRNIPIVVPDKQMYQFIAATDTHDKKLSFCLPDEIDFEKGVRVRLLGGVFDGLEGVFVKVKGKRNRRVVISIDNVLALTIEVSPDLIERLD